MTIAKGIGAMKESQKSIEKSMKGGTSRYIFIRDTESYLFRFMMDGDEIISGYFHRVPMVRGDRSWYQEVPCEGDDCTYCMSTDEEVSKRTYRFLVWVWVYSVDHEEPDEDAVWEPIEKEDGTFYREEVTAPRILKQGYFFSKLITAIYGKYGTLLDRDYECVRSGQGLKTTYSIFPEDKKAMTKKIKDAVKKLDDLEDIIFGSSDSDAEEEVEKRPAAKKATKPKGKRRPIVEEEEEEEEEMDDPFE